MKWGDLLGWIALVITSVSGIASVIFSPALFLTHIALMVAAVAAAKRGFTPALVTYGVWLLFHFGLHRYHHALFNTTNTVHAFVVYEFVFVNVVFVSGLSIGLILRIREFFHLNVK